MTKNGKKKVLLVANSTWNIYNFRLNVIDRFLEADYEVAVLAPIDQYLEYKENYPNIEHITIRTLNRDSTNPLKDIILIFELIRKYRIIKPDVVLHYTNKVNIYGAIAAMVNRITSVGIITGLGYPFIHSGWIQNVTSMLYKMTSWYHKRMIFENIEDRELFVERGIYPAEKGISIKGCGVNMDYYTPTEAVPINQNITIFTFIGRLLYDKGVREFVEAAKITKSKHKNVEFWIVGELDGNNPATVDKDELGKWVNEKIINYHGFQKDIRPFINQSSCIVLPSYREAIPRTITEGMAMAKPVITSDTAGCREAVEEGKNGFLVRIKDVNSLVETFSKFLNLSYDERKAMGQYGFKKARNEFDDKKIADQIFHITEEAMNEK